MDLTQYTGESELNLSKGIIMGDDDRISDTSNLMKFWPLLVACVAVISAATAGQIQINGHAEDLEKLKAEIKVTHDMQIRMEERQKVIQDDVHEIREGVKELQRLIRERDR